MWQSFQIRNLLLSLSICCALSCQPAATNTNIGSANTNVNATNNLNVNVNSNVANSSKTEANSTNSISAAVDTKEPEQYQATVSLKFATSGAQNLSTPPIKAEVARNGADRRMEFSLPNGEKLIYLDHDGKQLVISPNRKQFAELNKESTGIEIRKLLLPEQIVNQIKNLKGVERVGEEKVDGRDAIKYQNTATNETQTKAGTVSTESVILIDKETGLPLRSTTSSESQNGNLQGIKGLSFISEMNNIRTTVESNLFLPPTDYKQVAPEEIKQQIDLVFNAATAIIGQMLKSAQ